MPLNKDLESTLDPLLATFDDTLTATLDGQLTEIYVSGQAEMITWGKTKAGVPIAYEGPPISQAIDWAEKHGAKLVTQMNEETKRRLAKVVSDGIANKRGIPGLSRDLRSTFADMSKYRSELIARTETATALSEASLDSMKDMEIDGKEWVTAGDDLVSDECQGNEAEGVIPVGQTFSGGVMAPPQHPDCLLPENEVLPLGLVAMSKAYYSGQAIELLTRSGNKLTITPNHPILTPFGFVSADKLNEGDYVISCLNSEGMIFSIDPDYDYIPTTIEQIWESLLLSPSVSSVSMEVPPIDFHGDARFFYGDVNIINTNRFLGGDISNPFVSEHIGKNKFSLRGSNTFPLSGQGFPFPLGNGGSPALDSFMGGGNSPTSLDRGHQRHTDGVGLATIPRQDVSLKQTSTNDISTHTELSRQFLFRFASLITADELGKVRNFNFSGHVYNLQSLQQLYISNSIVVKNCRCALAPARLPK